MDLTYCANKNGFRLTDGERQLLQQQNAQFATALPGELELRDLLDFDLPEKRWSRASTTDLLQSLPRASHITAAQLGRIIKKLEKEDVRIKTERPKNKVRYFLPLINPPFSQVGDADAL